MSKIMYRADRAKALHNRAEFPRERVRFAAHRIEEFISRLEAHGVQKFPFDVVQMKRIEAARRALAPYGVRLATRRYARGVVAVWLEPKGL